jgi:probable rRNA maturation factor
MRRSRVSVAIADQQSVLKVSRRKLTSVVRGVLAAEGITSAEISVALIDDRAMHALNRRHLNHDYPTDVLSFLLADETPDGVRRIEGEIILSSETAAREAGRFGWNPLDELTLYLVHGLLHLCGYHDHSGRDRAAMRRREAEILQIWGLTPHYET